MENFQVDNELQKKSKEAFCLIKLFIFNLTSSNLFDAVIKQINSFQRKYLNKL